MAWAIYRIWKITHRGVKIWKKTEENSKKVFHIVEFHLLLFLGLAFFLFLATIKNTTFAGPQRYMIPVLGSIAIIQALVWRTLPEHYPKGKIAIIFLATLTFFSVVWQFQPGVGLRRGVREVKRLLASDNPPVAVFHCSIGSPQMALSYYNYKGPESFGISRKETDTHFIHNAIEARVPQGSRFVVFHYRAEDSHFVSLLDKEKNKYHIISKKEFNKSEVWVAERLNENQPLNQ
jgi:hypothetical protein